MVIKVGHGNAISTRRNWKLWNWYCNRDGKHCKFESKIAQRNLCGAFENRSKTIALQAIHLQIIAGVFLVHLPELYRIVSHAPLSVDNSRWRCFWQLSQCFHHRSTPQNEAFLMYHIDMQSEFAPLLHSGRQLRFPPARGDPALSPSSWKLNSKEFRADRRFAPNQSDESDDDRVRVPMEFHKTDQKFRF